MTKRDLSEEERREVYKKLKKYETSKNWKEILKDCESKWEELLEEIRLCIEERKETAVKHSELDKLNLYIEIFTHVIDRIEDSETGSLFKQHIQEQIDNANTNIYDKVEIGFDSPLYSDLDMLKSHRLIYINVYRKLEEIATYYDKIKEGIDDSNPYEMSEEDFKLSTDVN